MESEINLKASRMLNNMVVFLVVTFLLLFVASKGFSAEATGKTDAMQSVFNELKASEDSPIGTFLMIAGIIILVGFAMYMSFKGGSTPKAKTSKG
mgnify:CR=1 FL=1